MCIHAYPLHVPTRGAAWRGYRRGVAWRPFAARPARKIYARVFGSLSLPGKVRDRKRCDAKALQAARASPPRAGPAESPLGQRWRGHLLVSLGPASSSCIRTLSALHSLKLYAIHVLGVIATAH